MVFRQAHASIPQGGYYLIAGLGNPGREYRQTRHNIGFMLLDALAKSLSLSFTRVESKALVTRGDYSGRRLLLVKPQTYMNLSGQAIGALAQFYKVPQENLLVVYDDVDLPFGLLRLRAAGGAGGHKGMTSIIERLGSQDIPRLRVGIGRPPGRMEAADYVLQEFSKEESNELPAILDRGVEAIDTFVTQGIAAAMNHYNPAPGEA
jgi:peptidyl-tRNA hydrolase, PTH1 family